jgi:hypothetical protein
VTLRVRSGQRGQTQDYNCKFPNWGLTIIDVPWRSFMVRPSDLAVRIAAQHRDTFRLPIDAARRKHARLSIRTRRMA